MRAGRGPRCQQGYTAAGSTLGSDVVRWLLSFLGKLDGEQAGDMAQKRSR